VLSSDKPPAPQIDLSLGFTAKESQSSSSASDARESPQPSFREAERPEGETIADEASFFGWMYLTAVIVGVFPMFFDSRLFAVPWVVMLGYGIACYRRAKQTRTVFEFADSFYYLGFTLSVGALLASLEPLKGGSPDPRQVFRLFGLGLITTLFGVVGRTALQTFHRLPTETIEAVNYRLTAEARRYVDRLKQLNSEIETILGGQLATLREVLNKHVADYPAMVAQVTKDLAATAKSTASFGAHASAAEDALRLVAKAHNSAAVDIGNSTIEVVKARKELANSLVSVAAAGREIAERSVDETERIAGAAGDVVRALEQLNAGLALNPLDRERIGTGVREVAINVEGMATTLRRQSDQLGERLSSFKDTIASVARLRSDAESADIRGPLQLLAQEIDALKSQITRQRELSSQEVAALEIQVTAALKTTQQVSTALDEIAEATNTKLQRIGANQSLS
jgi:hypothetical protein